jgi:hypothetical protein
MILMMGIFFSTAFEELLSGQMDVYYEDRSLGDDPKILLQTILSLAEAAEKPLNDHKKLQLYNDHGKKVFRKSRARETG